MTTADVSMSDAVDSPMVKAPDPSLREQSVTRPKNDHAATSQADGNAPTLDLHGMSVKERRIEYAELFHGESRIETFKLPSLTDDYPDFAKEIVAAYLRFHTFRFKIYLNYDSAAGWFYTDYGRLSDCGKLVIGPRSLAKLQDAGAHECMYSNVVLDISTHFRTIASITIEVRKSRLDVGPVIDTFVNNKLRGEKKHETLSRFLSKVATAIQDPHQDVTNGKNGFDFADLEEVAKCFQVLPNMEQDYERRYSDYRGIWSTSWRNPGYLEHLNE